MPEMEGADRESPARLPSAYVHVPFCRHRCGYCNFTLVARRDDLIASYLQALEMELESLITPRPVATLFLGGGTPSHLTVAQLDSLLRILHQWFPLSKGGEFSVEANPADVSADRLQIFSDHGVNRISLGVQSFDAGKLSVLQRDHRSATIHRAVELVRKKIPHFSLDLIFAVPGENLAVWEADLSAAVRLHPAHVSTYGLTFEKGTEFWSRRRRGELAGPGEELERQMYINAMDRLKTAGYEHYEVSNFAQPGARCRHNEVYWTGGDYYAVGPGASRHMNGRREVNHRSTTAYLKKVLAGQSPIAESEQLSVDERARERLVFGLRRLEGVDLSALCREFDLSTDQLPQTAIERFVDQGLLERRGAFLRLTSAGLIVSDSLWPDLI